MNDVLVILGTLIFYFRIAKYSHSAPSPETQAPQNDLPQISVIVPARNEESNIEKCVQSLKSSLISEVIVVDDHSLDRTAEIALAAGAQVIKAKEKPDGWSGKSWACHQGASFAKSPLLLFTDADTEHIPGALPDFVGWFQKNNVQLASSLPFHQCPTLWEKLTGPFHLFLLFATAPFSNPKPSRLYANGQFLLFSREGYEKLGGHEAIKTNLAEDIFLAKKTIGLGMNYGVYTKTPLYKVRMYSDLAGFIDGWTRNFRLGLAAFHPVAVFEIVLLFMAVVSGFFFDSQIALANSIIFVSLMLSSQRRFGDFSALGPVLFPFALGLFIFVTLQSGIQTLFGRPFRWKGRAYS